MFSLLTQRIASRLGPLPAVRGITRARITITPTVLSLQTRRTFLTGTPRISFPTAATTTKKAENLTAGKTAAGIKKTGLKKPATKSKSKPKPKPKVKPKRKLAAKKKPAAKSKLKKPKKAQPTRIKLTKEDMPPRAPSNAYVIFYTKYIRGLPEHSKPKTIADISKCAKEASALWKTLSEADKQPFKDEQVAAREAHEIKRQAYFDTVPNAIFSEINRRRKNRGKKLIHKLVRPENRKPLSNFFRYMVEFRASPDAQAIAAKETDVRTRHANISRAAALQWKAMSDAEKAPYKKAASSELAAWRAKKDARV